MDMKKWVFITSYTRRILSTGVSYTRLTQSLPLYDLCRPAPTNPPKKDPNALSKLLQSTSILSLISKVRFNFSLMIAVNLLGRQNGHLNTCRYSTILILPNIRSPVTTFLSDGHQGEGRVWRAMGRGGGGNRDEPLSMTYLPTVTCGRVSLANFNFPMQQGRPLYTLTF